MKKEILLSIKPEWVEKIFTDVIQNYEIEDNIKDIELVLLERIKI